MAKPACSLPHQCVSHDLQYFSSRNHRQLNHGVGIERRLAMYFCDSHFISAHADRRSAPNGAAWNSPELSPDTNAECWIKQWLPSFGSCQ
jgi:hypothetical protein